MIERDRQLVYPLADILQLTLLLEQRGFKFTISNVGEEEVSVDVGRAKLTLKPEVYASTVDNFDYTALVLVNIARDLWVLAAYENKENVTYVCVIDGSKVGLNRTSAPLFSGKSRKYIVNALKAGVVREYRKTTTQDEWEKLHANAVPVEPRQDQAPEQQCGDAGTAGAA